MAKTNEIPPESLKNKDFVDEKTANIGHFWHEYLRMCVDIDIEEGPLEEIQRAFYAGALVSFNLLAFGKLVRPGYSLPERKEFMLKLHGELMEFREIHIFATSRPAQ